jgi:uncharacterized RDD family membrane protein YckC
MSVSPPPAGSWEAPEAQAGPAPGVEFAPHGARLVAYIIDGIIVSILCGILLIIGFAVFVSGATVVNGQVTSIGGGAAGAGTVVFILAFVLAFLYFPFFWARGGQTLGMKPFGLRVVSDRDGSRIGWGKALLRLVGTWVSSAVFYLGYIWIFIDKRRRGWHDLIAGTVVVRQP